MAVYFIQNVASKAIKIGMSWDPGRRLQELRTASPDRLQMLGCIPGGSAIEASLHHRFAPHRLRGEWFKGDPALLKAIHGLLSGETHHAPGGTQSGLVGKGSFWSTANDAFDRSDRLEYNSWRGKLTLSWFALSDALELLGIGPWADDGLASEAYARLSQLRDVMNEAPDWMES